MSDHIAMEFSEVAPYLYVGTNLCCQEHGARLRALGAQIDMSLEDQHTAEPNGFESFLWLPVPDHAAPTFCQLDVGTAVIAEAEERGYRAYLHCKNGHGRSPTMAIAFFIAKKRMSLREAEALVRSKRPEIMPTEAQRACLEEYERRTR